jgi:hypothetical protein
MEEWIDEWRESREIGGRDRVGAIGWGGVVRVPPLIACRGIAGKLALCSLTDWLTD